MGVCGGFARVSKLEVAVAKGRRVVDDIILSGVLVVLRQVYTLAPTRKSAGVWLNDEG